MAKILVIDDSRMMQAFLRRTLEAGGHVVEEWMPVSAMEIPEHVQESRPDLVLSDYAMAGSNGATVARMVHKAAPDLPVIVLTSFKNEELTASLEKLGVRAVLGKPIAPADLLAAVQEALGGPAAG